MEVRIGVADTPKELSIELDDGSDDLEQRIEDAVGGGAAVLWFTDRDGTRIGIPAAKVAYVELVTEDNNRRVGFGKA